MTTLLHSKDTDDVCPLMHHTHDDDAVVRVRRELAVVRTLIDELDRALRLPEPGGVLGQTIEELNTVARQILDVTRSLAKVHQSGGTRTDG